jgi:hypothetical protein
MKKLAHLFIVFLFLSCSHYTIEDGKYFSSKQDCIVIDGSESLLENKCNSIVEDLTIKQKRDKFKLKKKAHYSRLLPFIVRYHRYNFKIIEKSSTSFTLSPSSKRAKSYFENSSKIVFKSKFEFADPTNYYTKIIYHSSHCFGCCSELHLELDYSGNLKVTDNGRGWVKGCIDSVLNNNYFGKVSYDDLESLKNILKYSQLKTLDWPDNRRCYDAPDITLILYQNDKRYYFKINAPCVPIVSRQLTGFLNRLFRYETLKKVDTTFTYEK